MPSPARRILGAALIATQACARGPAPSAQPAPAPLEARVDAFVRPYVAGNNFSGVILVARGGHVLLERGYGLANPELGVPNTSRTRFHVASVTKAFTAAAVLRLAERGMLRLDDSVGVYLPGYPDGGRIRLEHLLTHSSGIPDLGSLPEWDREERLPHTTAELVEMFKGRPLLFEPGTETRYSNANYNLLALILERLVEKGIRRRHAGRGLRPARASARPSTTAT